MKRGKRGFYAIRAISAPRVRFILHDFHMSVIVPDRGAEAS